MLPREPKFIELQGTGEFPRRALVAPQASSSLKVTSSEVTRSLAAASPPIAISRRIAAQTAALLLRISTFKWQATRSEKWGL